jgi:hypothetical protein
MLKGFTCSGIKLIHPARKVLRYHSGVPFEALELTQQTWLMSAQL